MVNYTPNLNLAKPILSDVADITVISNNFDILDSALAKMVTTDSPQEITGSKTFSGTVIVNGHNLRNAVTTDEEQTITKEKTHTANIILRTDTYSTTSGSNNWTGRFTISDGTHNVGAVQCYSNGNGLTRTYLNATHPTNRVSASLGIDVKSDGSSYGVAPIPTDNAPSNAIITKANVMSTDGKLNNLVHTIGDENIDGVKTMVKHLKSVNVGVSGRMYITVAGTRWYEVCRLSTVNTSRYIIELAGGVNGQASLCWGKIMIVSYANNVPYGAWIERYSVANAGYIVGDCCAIVKHTDTNTVSVYMKMQQWWGIDFNVTDARIQNEDISPASILVRGQFTPDDMDTLSGTYDILQNMTAR